MRPRLECCYFPPATALDDEQWPRMARVLAHTAAQHCSHWDVTIETIAPGPMPSLSQKPAHETNAQKTADWCARVEQAPDGTRILLIDADTFILRPLDDIWDQPFDLAYTVRTWARPSAFPLNGGVVFLVVSDVVREFMRRWRDETKRMLIDQEHHRIWVRAFGGLAQAALGCILERDDHGVTLRALPCCEWNCEDSAWQWFDPARTRIVHVKSALRRAIFSVGPTRPELRPLMSLWRSLERAAARGKPDALVIPERHQGSIADAHSRAAAIARRRATARGPV
jgi:hypothetical protein